MDLDQLAASLVAAQAEFSAVPKTADNPFFKSKYADLATVVHHTQPILAKHGLAVTQHPTTLDGEPALTTHLLHSSGQKISDTMKLCAAKNDPQGQGAAITYARRFAYMAVLGLVADEDDDGNSATRSKQSEPRRAQPAKSPAEKARLELQQICADGGLNLQKIGERFYRDHGVKITAADVDTVRAFAKLIGEEIAVDKAAQS